MTYMILKSYLYKALALLWLSFNLSVALAQTKLSAIAIQKGSYSDLFSGKKPDSIKQLIGNAQVVLLGEPTHGDGHIFKLKTEMVKFLHQEMGFSVLAFESGLVDLALANQAIAAGENTTKALENSVFNIWTGSAQFRPLLHYIEEQKTSLKVAGFDAQLTGTYSTDLFVDEIQKLLTSQSKDQKAVAKIDFDYLDQIVGYMNENFEFPSSSSIASFEKWSLESIRLLRLLVLNNQATSSKRDFLVQGLKSTLALAKNYVAHNPSTKTESNFVATDSNPRDKQMAENILFLMEQFKGRKIICWGANTHFANRVDLLNNQELQTYFPIGRILKPILKEKLCIIGATAGGGSYGSWTEEVRQLAQPLPNTIEHALLSQNVDVALVDLKSASNQTTSFAIEYTSLTGQWDQVFDLLLYVKTTGPSTPYTREDTQAVTQSNTNEVQTTTQNDPAKENVGNKALEHQSFLKVKASVKDVETGKAIAFATIQTTEGGPHTVANEEGIFSLNVPAAKDFDLVISHVGYQTQSISLSKLQRNAEVRLKAKPNQLQGVTITAKRTDPVQILKEAIERIPQNYIQTDFNANCYVRTQSTNVDTLVADEEYLIKLYAKKGYQKDDVYAGNVKQANIKKMPAYASGIFVPLTGSSAWLNNADLVKTNPLFNLGLLKKYQFTLDSVIYQEDEKIYVISFKAKQSTHRVTGLFYMKGYSGTLYINHSDKAIIKASVSWQRDTAIMNRYAQNSMGKKMPNPIFSNSYEEERISLTNLYQRTANGQYAIYYGLMNWNYDGKSLKDDSKLSVKSSLLFLTENVTTNPIEIINRRTAFYRLAGVANNPLFWEQYNRPFLNDK